MIPYNDYDIQITGSGCLVRNASGEAVFEAATEEEAMEFIDDIKEEYREEQIKPNTLTPYEKFEAYSKRCPGRCYIEGKLASCYEQAMTRIAKSFEKTTGYVVIISSEYHGGELFAVIEDVY